MPNFSDYLTISDAALRLGASPSTLRNWDRTGKLKAQRHPINGYRLYSGEEIDRLVNKIGGKSK